MLLLYWWWLRRVAGAGAGELGRSLSLRRKRRSGSSGGDCAAVPQLFPSCWSLHREKGKDLAWTLQVSIQCVFCRRELDWLEDTDSWPLDRQKYTDRQKTYRYRPCCYWLLAAGRAVYSVLLLVIPHSLSLPLPPPFLLLDQVASFCTHRRINQSAKGLPARPLRQSESTIPSTTVHRSLPFRLLRFPLKLPFLPASGLFLFSLFLFFFFPFLHPFRPLDTEKNPTDFGVPLGRPRERFRSRRQYGPCKARGHQLSELNWFFLCGGVLGCFAFSTVQRGVKVSQSVAITILLRRQRYPPKYFPNFLFKTTYFFVLV